MTLKNWAEIFNTQGLQCLPTADSVPPEKENEFADLLQSVLCSDASVFLNEMSLAGKPTATDLLTKPLIHPGKFYRFFKSGPTEVQQEKIREFLGERGIITPVSITPMDTLFAARRLLFPRILDEVAPYLGLDLDELQVGMPFAWVVHSSWAYKIRQFEGRTARICGLDLFVTYDPKFSSGHDDTIRRLAIEKGVLQNEADYT